METFAIAALNFFYFQTWLVCMVGTYWLTHEKHGEQAATAGYVFLAYLALMWHPLIGEVFQWLRQ